MTRDLESMACEERLETLLGQSGGRSYKSLGICRRLGINYSPFPMEKRVMSLNDK